MVSHRCRHTERRFRVAQRRPRLRPSLRSLETRAVAKRFHGEADDVQRMASWWRSQVEEIAPRADEQQAAARILKALASKAESVGDAGALAQKVPPDLVLQSSGAISGHLNLCSSCGRPAATAVCPAATPAAPLSPCGWVRATGGNDRDLKAAGPLGIRWERSAAHVTARPDLRSPASPLPPRPTEFGAMPASFGRAKFWRTSDCARAPHA